MNEGDLVALSGASSAGLDNQLGPHLHTERIVDLTYPTNNGMIYGRIDPTTVWGALAAQGTITPLSEEDDMPGIEEFTAVIDSRIDELTKRTNDQHAETRKRNEAQHIKTRDVVRNDTQAQQDVTRGYLADLVKEASPGEIAALVPDALAQQVIDALAARLGAK